MPATSLQLLAVIPGIADGGATATNPTPNLCNATAVLSVSNLQAVGAGSAPRPMSGTAAITIRFAGTVAQTTTGVARGSVSWGIALAGAGQSGSYNPRADIGLIPYGGIVGNNVLMDGIPSAVNLSLLTMGMPTSLAAAAGWQSGPVDAMGLKHISWSMTSTQTINLSLTRYTDRQGASSIGAVTATATANAAMSLNNADGSGFMAFSLGATNTTGSTATLSSYGLLLQAS